MPPARGSKPVSRASGAVGGEPLVARRLGDADPVLRPGRPASRGRSGGALVPRGGLSRPRGGGVALCFRAEPGWRGVYAAAALLAVNEWVLRRFMESARRARGRRWALLRRLARRVRASLRARVPGLLLVVWKENLR